MVRIISDKQNSRIVWEPFKDKLQFLKSKISSVTRLSLTPFGTHYWLKHSAASFVIFPFSAMADRFTLLLNYFPWQHFANDNSHWLWLAVVSEVHKKHLKQRKTNKKVEKFKKFSTPNKEIKYIWRTLTEFKDFSRWLVKFKTFSRLHQPWSFDCAIQITVNKDKSKVSNETDYTTQMYKIACYW